MALGLLAHRIVGRIEPPEMVGPGAREEEDTGPRSPHLRGEKLGARQIFKEPTEAGQVGEAEIGAPTTKGGSTVAGAGGHTASRSVRLSRPNSTNPECAGPLFLPSWQNW